MENSISLTPNLQETLIQKPASGLASIQVLPNLILFTHRYLLYSLIIAEEQC